MKFHARDMNTGIVSSGFHGNGNIGAKLEVELPVDIFAAIKGRRA
jgi:hypothetical protein